MTPEQRARAEIDRLLGLAGWAVHAPFLARAQNVPEFVTDSGAFRQAKKEFDQYVSPVNNDKFGEEYIVQHLTSNLPPPDVIAQEIVDDLEAALEQFRLIADDLKPKEIAA
ncbi:MAG TPA: hypothetical protein VFQ20_10590 [Burkholderiaceae bacterium]|nr:hypothetical protein [Burkholderiaceae bacterium]